MVLFKTKNMKNTNVKINKFKKIICNTEQVHNIYKLILVKNNVQG